ncbi:MAG: tRNA (cytidine(34)-2'-O)-methyltransferase [Firmicutes bacterium]|nr:tRNA (cytidine(34)-2'-O)-methyltransferase [Alicyclobacillaceae bacterium]MCL6496477.1 tRNA (cytidine(34)-2'-O)-methyltransferase [Bacillota bacterium]
MRVVLVEPEIPPNTGNIARTCAATHTALDLIEPLGFSLSDRYLKRAGVDYWHLVSVRVHRSWSAFLDSLPNPPPPLWLFTARGGVRYDTVAYGRGDCLVFGRESTGLPEWLLEAYPHRWCQIPMALGVRSLNLSNAVAVVVYEALRQQGFPGLAVTSPEP